MRNRIEICKSLHIIFCTRGGLTAESEGTLKFYSSAVVRDGKMKNPTWGTALKQLCYKHVAGFMELQFRERELIQPLWEKGKEDFVLKFRKYIF